MEYKPGAEAEAGAPLNLTDVMKRRSARLQTANISEIEGDQTPVVIENYEGLGDNIYTRPYVIALSKTRPVYVWTPWPELFQGHPNIFFVKPDGCGLRSQSEHVESLPPEIWSNPPAGAKHVILDREECVARKTTFLQEFDKLVPEVKHIDFEMKVPEEWKDAALRYLPPVLAGKPFCLARLPTLRREWLCEARNPNHEAFRSAMARMRQVSGFPVIAIADVAWHGDTLSEWVDGDYSTVCDFSIMRGMPLPHLIGLYASAEMIVCSPSYALPLGIAVRTPTFVVYGGHLASETLYDKRMGGTYAWVGPDPFCDCNMNECKRCCTQEGKRIDAKAIHETVDAFYHTDKFKIHAGSLLSIAGTVANPGKWQATFAITKTELRIAVPSGIGDIAWSLTKISGIKKLHPQAKINIRIQNTPFNRALDFVKHFDFVDEAGYENFEIHPKGKSPVGQDGCYNYLDSGENKHGFDYFLLANGHLERGGKVEDWLPELETDWEIAKHWKPVIAEQRFADALMPETHRMILMYFGPKHGNTVAGHNRGELWTPDDWVFLVNKCLNADARNRIIIVGATYDADYAESILAKIQAPDHILCMVGKTTCGEVFQLVKRAKCVIGYPSGIPIFAAFMRIPTITWMRKPGDSIREDIMLSFSSDMRTNMVPPFAMGERNCDSPLYAAFDYGTHHGKNVWDFLEHQGWV